MRVEDKAFVLHTRQYRETSAIIRLLTERHGLLSGIVKGVYATNKRGQQLRSQLQAGNQLDIEWLEKSSALKSITQIEHINSFPLANTKAFLCLAYAGELSLKLLAENQSADVVYEAYSQLGQLLQEAELIEPGLRLFEFTLLEYMGLQLDLHWDCLSRQLIDSHQSYAVIVDQGVRLARPEDKRVYPGKVLQAIAQKDFSDSDTLRHAKSLARQLIHHALAGKTLKTRQLYRDMLG